MKKTFLLLLSLFSLCTAVASTRYAGGDISLLPAYEEAGAQYFDHDGTPVAEFIPWCRAQGMNAMRVRLFVNPDRYRDLHLNDADTETRYDPNASQDIEEILPLCRRIVEAGMALMLDFHYSDTWADPAKQSTPIDWEGLDDDALVERIYDYTRQSLLTLRAAGITPAFIQTGNEISYGMLWGPLGTADPQKALLGNDANWERLGRLLRSAGRACREVCPDAKIVLHTERVADIPVLTNFYSMMATLGVDYDIIGLSYYPFWHGDMAQLSSALDALESSFPTKRIMVVETGYALLWQVPYEGIIDHTDVWPVSDEGQAKFAADLVATLEKHPAVDGLFWWWMEYNPYGTSLTGWYNAPLFDPLTGRASSAFKTICSFAGNDSSLQHPRADSAAAPDAAWDIHGCPVPPDAPGLVVTPRGKRLNP